MGKKVVVIGGGIVGLSCGFFAKREGFDVTIVDPGIDEAQASFGNAGVLALCEQLPLATPELMRQLPRMLLSSHSPLTIRWRYLPTLLPWMIRFALASSPRNVNRATQSLHTLMSGALDAHKEISIAANASSMLKPTGWIKAWEKAPRNTASQERETLSNLGIGMRDLSSKELTDIAPGFNGVFEAATLFSDCYQVTNPGMYVKRVTDACAGIGIRFVRGKVTDFSFENGVVRGVFTDGDPPQITADNFVIAGGAWSKRLAATLGDHVPLDTERGYHFMLDVGGRAVLHAPLLWQEKSIVLSPMDDGLRMTSSVEFAGLEAPARYDNIERTFTSLQSMVPALAGAAVRTRWLGFRPSVPDSVPVIGSSSKYSNCLFAFGHGHLGLTLGPVTGKLIASQLAEKLARIDISPFSPSRFC